ncbi:MAG: hypothetical protein AAFU71_14400 [Cyanobacteria bacterium J06632_22]
MIYLPRYWQMKCLTASGEIRLQTFPQARDWFRPLFAEALTEAVMTEADCHRLLWQRAPEDDLAQLCLRCWLSHHIVDGCNQLVRQFGTTYNFEAQELWPFVLDDDGRLLPNPKSLALKILAKYNPDKGASLSTWASQLVKTHRELNRFFLQQGLYRISPWAILNDTKISQLARVLPYLSPGEIEAASELLAAYHRVYRRGRMATAPRTRRCPDPTDEQLQAINPNEPPSVVYNQLYDLADKLRQYRIAVRQGWDLNIGTLDDGTAQPVIAPTPDEAETEQEDFLQRYRQQFLATLDTTTQQVLKTYIDKQQQRRTPQGHAYYQAMRLFHCDCLSMGAIAKQLSLANQVQVTRLLHLRRFRTEIAIEWVAALKQQVKVDAAEYLSPDQLDEADQKLEQILIEETNAVMEEAQAEAQIAKNRTADSVFARCMCRVLDQLSPPPPPD